MHESDDTVGLAVRAGEEPHREAVDFVTVRGGRQNRATDKARAHI